MHGVIAAHVVAAELDADLDDFGVEVADLPRRHQHAAGTRETRDPPSRCQPAGLLVRGEVGDQFVDPIGGGIPVRCVGGNREVLGAPHQRDEPPESRGFVEHLEPGKPAAKIPRVGHAGGLRTSRRTMVWSRPGPTPMQETCAPASSSSRST